MLDATTLNRRNIVGIRVRYLNERYDSQGVARTYIQNRTIGIKNLQETSDAETMLKILNEKVFSLDPNIKKNFVGYVHDHAATLSGHGNGLLGLLKNDISQPFMDLKDPCHSFSLALNQALQNLPEIMRFIEDIHSHFSWGQRVAQLYQVQFEKKRPVLGLKRYVATRWLSLGESVQRLLLIWDDILEYMKNLKEKTSNFEIKREKEDEFLKILEDKHYRIKIRILGALISRLNGFNIEFQSQDLEIQNLLLKLRECALFFGSLILIPKYLPRTHSEFKSESWKVLDEEKLLSTNDFILNLIRDVNSDLKPIDLLPMTEKENLKEIFQSFISTLFCRLIHYLPLEDEFVNTLDFVTLNMEKEDLKNKILKFNEVFKIVPENSIHNLTSEISSLAKESLTLLRIEAKDSSLYLWDLVRQTSTKYKLLEKIFKVAHVLPISSAPIEQAFSTLKLIQDCNRTRLREDTSEGLLLVHEHFKNKEVKVSRAMLQSFKQVKAELINKKVKNPSDLKDEGIIELEDEENKKGKGKEEEEEENFFECQAEASMRNAIQKRKTPLIEEESFKPSLKIGVGNQDFSDYSYSSGKSKSTLFYLRFSHCRSGSTRRTRI